MFRVAGIVLGAYTAVHPKKLACFWSKPAQQPASSGLVCSPNCPGRIKVVAESVIKSVVSIETEIEISVKTGVFRSEKAIAASRGSGFIIDSEGYILTNAHVVQDVVDGGTLTIKTYDGHALRGKLVAIDQWSDFALLKVEGKNFHAVELGDSDQLGLGEWLFTYGDPMGLGHSLTSGIVSSLNRQNKDIQMNGRMDSRMEYLQANFPGLDFGNSGGAVFNLQGQVVGITTIKAETDGICFAIQINSALPVIRQLMETGKVVRPWLGLKLVTITDTVRDQMMNLDEEVAEVKTFTQKPAFALPIWPFAKPEEPLAAIVQEDASLDDVKALLTTVNKGVLILAVCEQSPAESAKCQVGDVVILVNDKRVASTTEFFQTIGYSPEPFTLTVKRAVGGKIQVHELKVEPEQLDIFDHTRTTLNSDDRDYEDYVKTLTPEQQAKLKFLEK